MIQPSVAIGMTRFKNEGALYGFLAKQDDVTETPEFGLFIVADGVEGLPDAEKACSLAVQVMAKAVISEWYLPLLGHSNTPFEHPTVTEALTDGLEKANSVMREKLEGAGVVVTALHFWGNKVYIAYIGNIRVYHIDPTKAAVEQLTRDYPIKHSSFLGLLDEVNPELEYVGQKAEADINVIRRTLRPQTHLLICNKGLWNTVNRNEIRDNVLIKPNPQEACTELETLAKTRGETDNISAMLISIFESLPT